MSTLSTTNLKNPSSGSNNIVLGADGSATITTLTGTTITGTSVRGGITSGTTVASTSGTSIDFTGIPSWVKRVTVMFAGVSTNGGDPKLIQLGTSGGVVSTGYVSNGAYCGPGYNTMGAYTSGFIWMVSDAPNLLTGHAIITLLGSNTWVHSATVTRTDDGYVMVSAGSKTLSGTLDRIRITTTNGTNAFDAGSVNILYEG
jgi:hypothetical protein